VFHCLLILSISHQTPLSMGWTTAAVRQLLGSHSKIYSKTFGKDRVALVARLAAQIQKLNAGPGVEWPDGLDAKIGHWFNANKAKSMDTVVQVGSDNEDMSDDEDEDEASSKRLLKQKAKVKQWGPKTVARYRYPDVYATGKAIATANGADFYEVHRSAIKHMWDDTLTEDQRKECQQLSDAIKSGKVVDMEMQRE
jgi:hypothetical protein